MTPEEFAEHEAKVVAASAAVDQVGAAYRPLFVSLAGFEKGAAEAGLSYSAAAKLTVEFAKTTGFPWGFGQ